MEPLVVVTHATPVHVSARALEAQGVPPETVALGFYIGENVIARGVVAESALPTINALLADPVTVALAATEDDQGNIDARVCIVVRVSQEDDAADANEPWKASVPPPPFEAGEEGEVGAGAGDVDGEEEAGLALVPLGNVVRSSTHRQHPDLAGDARDMLANLLTGRTKDAVDQAIDDLLDSI